MAEEIQAPQGAPISNHIEFMIANWIDKMVRAESERNWHAYFTYCTNALQLVKSHIDIRDRQGVQKDWEVVKAALAEAEKLTNMETKNQTIAKIMKAFVDAHKFYIYGALPGMGIIRNEEDGVIDFDKTELETLIKIVRSDDGMEEAIRNATEQ